MFEAELDEVLSQGSELERLGREHGVFWSAADLMGQEFPEPRWAVPGLVAEGLNLVVGAPKFGKSWLCLNLAVAVATGGRALGRIPVQQGSVLYAALEDTPRRLQARLETVTRGEQIPEALSFITSLPRMPHATELLDGWLDDHHDARLVIIDVLRKVRPAADGRTGRAAYDEDYDTAGALKALADRHGVAVVAVHHTRKAADESDVFNEVSGSAGITGAAGTILLAKRARNEADAVLHLTGRDVTEAEFGLDWHAESCSWNLLDEPVTIATLPGTQRSILTYLESVPAASFSEIVDGTGLHKGTVKSGLSRMVDKDVIAKDTLGNYFVVGTSGTSQASGTSGSGKGGTSGTLKPHGSDKGFHLRLLGTSGGTSEELEPPGSKVPRFQEVLEPEVTR